VVTIVAIVVLVSCNTTRNAQFVDVDQMVAKRDYETAIKAISAPDAGIYSDRDKALLALDVAMLYHLAGNSKASTRTFNDAEQFIQENFSKSVTNAAASFLINDYMLEYYGEDYEDIYLNVFKALDFARLGSFDGAWVEVRRVNNKLNLLEDKYKKLADGMNSDKNSGGSVKAGSTEFHDSALARYLSLILYRGDGRPDDAALDLKKLKEAFSSQPSVYNYALPKLDAMLASSAKTKVNLISFTGKAPSKRANTLTLSTKTDTILVKLQTENSKGVMETKDLSAMYVKGIDGGYNFKCQLPEMVKVPSRIAKVVVNVDGKPAGELAVLESIENTAIATFKVKEPITFAKTVIRTVVKGILAAEGKKAISKKDDGILGLLLGVAVDVAVDASEQADLRSSRFFPGKAWVGEFELDDGKHDIVVQYLDASGNTVYTDSMSTTVNKKGLNLLSSYALL